MGMKLNEQYPHFYAWSTKSTCTDNNYEIIPFQYVSFDNTNSWNQRLNYYKSPIKGLYYIDISLAIEARSSMKAYITVNEKRILQLYQSSTDHKDHVITRSGLIEMNENDILQILYKGCTENLENESSILIFFHSHK